MDSLTTGLYHVIDHGGIQELKDLMMIWMLRMADKFPGMLLKRLFLWIILLGHEPTAPTYIEKRTEKNKEARERKTWTSSQDRITSISLISRLIDTQIKAQTIYTTSHQKPICCAFMMTSSRICCLSTRTRHNENLDWSSLTDKSCWKDFVTRNPSWEPLWLPGCLTHKSIPLCPPYPNLLLPRCQASCSLVCRSIPLYDLKGLSLEHLFSVFHILAVTNALSKRISKSHILFTSLSIHQINQAINVSRPWSLSWWNCWSQWPDLNLRLFVF